MMYRIITLLLALSMAIPPSLLATTCQEPPSWPAGNQLPIALPDIGPTDSYYGYSGLLYDTSNAPPDEHRADGLTAASLIAPINGKVVFLSIGFSNNTIEFCGGSTFLAQDGDDPAATDCPTPVPLADLSCSMPPAPNPCPYNQIESFLGQAFRDQTGQVKKDGSIVLVDGAKGGQVLACWDPTGYDPEPPPPMCVDNYARVDDILASANLMPSQVQAVWLKMSDGFYLEPLPLSLKRAGQGLDQQIDAFIAEKHLGNILRGIKDRYKNVRQVFISPRTYGGFAYSSHNILNPEPYAYELGFSIKWLISSQIQQVHHQGDPHDAVTGDLRYSSVPWISWGPYLWRDGSKPCEVWQVCLNSDFRYNWPENENGHSNECTHPSTAGEQKVGAMLLNFMKNSPFTAWFRP